MARISGTRNAGTTWRGRVARCSAALLLGRCCSAGGIGLVAGCATGRPIARAIPVQGVEIGGRRRRGRLRRAARRWARDFVYLDASDGARRRDPRFAANLAAAREAGLQVGAVHRFDPCVPADGQAANFVTMVPRDARCCRRRSSSTAGRRLPGPVSEAAMESELTTLLNQIEAHTGKPAILKLSRGVREALSHRRADRAQPVGERATSSQPDYAGRPWVMWTANPRCAHRARRRTPLRWVVVRP